MKRRLKTTANNLNKYLWQKLDETYMKTLIIHLFFTRTPFYPFTPTNKNFTYKHTHFSAHLCLAKDLFDSVKMFSCEYKNKIHRTK